jgi:ribosome-binding protein aMBF1 (putative translation factor)
MTTLQSPSTNRLLGGLPPPVSSTNGGRGLLSIVQVELAPPIPARYSNIEDVVARAAKDERKKKALQEARKRLAEKSYGNRKPSIAVLRLKLGMSQTDLAVEMNSSQSHIARIESGTEDLRMSTLEKLAKALKISAVDAFKIVRSKSRNKK